MKSTIVLTVFLLLLCTSLSAQNAPAPLAEDPGAKKARAILDQMIQAMGGEAFLNFRDMSQQGRTAGFYQGRPSGTSTPYWLFWKWPDMERLELTKQRDVIYIHNGDKGYEITYKGTRLEDPEDHKTYERRHMYALQVILRRWLKQPGTLLFYDGTGIADQKQVDKVTILNGNNQSVTLWIDSFSHLLVRKTFQWREAETRYSNEEAEVYGNYHAVQGIQTPRSRVSLHNGEVNRQRFIEGTTLDYDTSLVSKGFIFNNPNAKSSCGCGTSFSV